MPSTPALAAPHPRRAALTVLAAAAAVLAIVAAMGGGGWLFWLAKPLATLSLLVLAGAAEPPLSPRYRRRVLAGLALALVGDILLMLPADLFVPGLVAFLLAHLCFLAAWLDDSRLGVRPLPWAACLLVAAALVWRLWPDLDAPLRPAVIAYAAVLATMAGQAVGRAGWHGAHADALAVPARWAALGGLLFLASDSLLAIDRFATPLRWAPLWILGTYYPAIWAIARSVERVPRTAAVEARA